MSSCGARNTAGNSPLAAQLLNLWFVALKLSKRRKKQLEMGAFRYLLDGLFRLGNRLSRPEALCQNGACTQKALFRNRHNYVIIS
jgi:hypothetical protein